MKLQNTPPSTLHHAPSLVSSESSASGSQKSRPKPTPQSNWTSALRPFCDSNHPPIRNTVEEFFLTPMPVQKPTTPKPAPALYELRHLRRALARLEATHATTSPTIENLKRNVLNRIRELEAQLGSTELTDALTTLRNM
jgi:hypothetical protein